MANLIPDQEELAWAAGLFDGEGSTYATSQLHKGVTTKALGLTVASSSISLLRRFNNAVGGDGSITGPSRYGRTRKSMWYLTWRSQDAVRGVLAILWSNIGLEKRAQATKVLLGQSLSSSQLASLTKFGNITSMRWANG